MRLRGPDCLAQGRSREHFRAQRYPRKRLNLNTGSDESCRSHPASRAQCDGRNFQFEIFPSKFVSPCAKISTLADADIGFDCDSGETENSHVFADPDMIANLQSPRERNVYVPRMITRLPIFAPNSSSSATRRLDGQGQAFWKNRQRVNTQSASFHRGAPRSTPKAFAGQNRNCCRCSGPRTAISVAEMKNQVRRILTRPARS
jgi:hypothetical protein